MAITVTLRNASQITADQLTDKGGDLVLSRHIYQLLGSLIQNKHLTKLYDDGDLPKEYVKILDDLDDLFIKKNYPELGQDIVLADHIVELDEYLGSLGVDTTYLYSKDIVDIPAWVKVTEANDRYLIDKSDGSYLADNNYVLIAYARN